MNILVTTDGSGPSRRVLPHAARFAAACDGRLTLARVLNPLVDLAGEFATTTDAAAKRFTEAWESDLGGVLTEAGVQGTPLVPVQAHGEDAHDAILRVAAEIEADVRAMHSRGIGVLRHALLGSVAMGVLGHSARPVLLTGEHVENPSGQGPYRLMITSDGSAASLDIVRALLPLMAGRGVVVKLVRVFEPRSGRASPGAEHEACRNQLEKVRLEHFAGLDVEGLVPVAGHEQAVAETIIETAADLGVDAIAMSTHGHGALRHLLAGSVALDVLARSPLPVFLARAGE